VIKKLKLNWDGLAGTGDLLVSRRWTGYSTTKMLLEGSFASHVSMIVKEEHNIFVIES